MFELKKSRVELRRRYSDADATQLDVELSTRSQREQLSPISSERRDPDSQLTQFVGHDVF